MPRSARYISSSGIYHVVLRGNNHQRIFEEDEDYRTFLRILNDRKKESGLKIYAWCLMPNHIHLLLKEGTEPVSEVFRRFGTAFVYWYNVKYKRSGHLFQDRFRSEAVEDESYFLTVFRYIHLNPVKAGLCHDPEEYQYSSYSHYFKSGNYSDTDMILNLMEKKDLELFHQEKNEDICLDIDNIAVRITDEEISRIVREKFNPEHLSDIQTFSKENRDTIISFMKKSGASIRQINRLTGISIRIIRNIH